MVQLLINKGAKIDQADDHGKTPLFIAFQEGHLDVINALLKKKGGKTKAEKRNRSESEEEKPLPKKVRTK